MESLLSIKIPLIKVRVILQYTDTLSLFTGENRQNLLEIITIFQFEAKGSISQTFICYFSPSRFFQ